MICGVALEIDALVGLARACRFLPPLCPVCFEQQVDAGRDLVLRLRKPLPGAFLPLGPTHSRGAQLRHWLGSGQCAGWTSVAARGFYGEIVPSDQCLPHGRWSSALGA